MCRTYADGGAVRQTDGPGCSINGDDPMNGVICPTDDGIFFSALVQNTCEQALLQGKTMNSHNTKTESVVRKESVRIEADQEEVRVIKSGLIKASELAISDDDDKGSDPYNSTGHHIIIKSRVDPLD